MGRKVGVRYRCLKCWTRRTLPRRVEEYVRKPKCLGCGALLTYEDKYRQNTELKRRPCECGDPVFPHRPGGSVWCQRHPTGPSELDQEERWG